MSLYIVRCLQIPNLTALSLLFEGMFIEKATSPNNVTELDRLFMDHLCERIKPKPKDGSDSVAEGDEKQVVDDTDLGGKGDL